MSTLIKINKKGGKQAPRTSRQRRSQIARSRKPIRPRHALNYQGHCLESAVGEFEALHFEAVGKCKSGPADPVPKSFSCKSKCQLKRGKPWGKTVGIYWCEPNRCHFRRASYGALTSKRKMLHNFRDGR